MSKLSFRARALDASKPMPIYMAEELPDLPDYSAINRAVPQMPTGMEKEEECEHHLQRAICAGLIIPTPEVSEILCKDFYDKVYPANYKQPRQLIHMQPFTMEQDIPDYDMDSEDERWLQSQAQKLELSPLKFEEMMDRLEKSSGQTVVTLNEAKALLKEDDDLIIAVFDYWLNKRLKTQHPLILTVKTEQRAGIAANNPYLAFRRRTEKMQTRKIRKNDETSYEKMLKLRRDLHRAVTLLELVKKREKTKRELVQMTADVFEKRFQAKDFSGSIYVEASAIKTSRPAFTPIFHNHYTNQTWTNRAVLKDDVIPRKEKRQYKKRKHKSLGHNRNSLGAGYDAYGVMSSDEESPAAQLSPEPEENEEDGQFTFRRNKFCSYHMPLPKEGNWPWCSLEENGLADKRFRFTLTSLSNPRRCIGFARRRMGRGGRIILDRISTNSDEFWRTLDFNIIEPKLTTTTLTNDVEIETLNNFNQHNVNYNVNTTINNNLKDDIKCELNNFNSDSIKSDLISCIENESDDVKLEIKQEFVDDVQALTTTIEATIPTEDEANDMVEFLRSIRRDWLHFRPKTPPPGYESSNDTLQNDNLLLNCANSSFSMEILPLEAPSVLLDTSTFITEPFNFENLENIDVPITDTRQQQQQQQFVDKVIHTNINLNVNVGLNTLTPNSVSEVSFVNNDSIKLIGGTIDTTMLNDDRTMGCSKFFITDISGSDAMSKSVSNTLPSLKYNNNINTVSYEKFIETTISPIPTITTTSATSITTTSTTSTTITMPNENSCCSSSTLSTTSSTISNSNGLLPQFEFDVSTCRTKNNKISYAYQGGVGYSNASSSTLSLHTSAHTLTLNSHSANILEIPLTNDTNTVSSKLVNSADTNSTATTNNKTKSIVRKNNLVMEVT